MQIKSDLQVQQEAQAKLKMSELIKECTVDRTETCFIGKGKTYSKDLNPLKGREYLRTW